MVVRVKEVEVAWSYQGSCLGSVISVGCLSSWMLASLSLFARQLLGPPPVLKEELLSPPLRCPQVVGRRG